MTIIVDMDMNVKRFVAIIALPCAWASPAQLTLMAGLLSRMGWSENRERERSREYEGRGREGRREGGREGCQRVSYPGSTFLKSARLSGIIIL